jgi:hypothetical protein
MSLSQKDAVFKAMTTRRHPDGSFDRKEVVDELTTMYRAGEFIHGEPQKLSDDKALRDYCGSMLSNWLRKDARLGGAEAGAIKVSRKKSKPADDEMKRLMMAKVVLTKENQPTNEIDALIAQRSKRLDEVHVESRNEAVADAERLLAAINHSQ